MIAVGLSAPAKKARSSRRASPVIGPGGFLEASTVDELLELRGRVDAELRERLSRAEAEGKALREALGRDAA